ncbi:hypothetical protein GCM10011529_00640 [Polymorphobacter glacialis]|uniref:Tetratricopeptide repeat protein n=1 Tax=Sandarakinorhabdus glacialis TaxID=1614636 RepID=A0A916ZHP5_9SPHN|nr:tetratricopeptide repeat protein [Polymorphobacter glacialis]GGD98498.1 hypothetical protein GCM10011529_00640 [Polymorphobacter glacialis]
MTKPPLLFVLAILSGTSADASVSVIGQGYARGCFEAAEGRQPTREALKSCDRALGESALSADDRVATIINRGIVRMQARDLPAAIADFDEAIRARPDAAEAYVNKGIALIRLGDRDTEAVFSLSEGIARNPLRPEIAFYNRAVAYEGLGRNREAYEDYSRAAQLAPEWPEPATQLQRFQTVKRKTAGV